MWVRIPPIEHLELFYHWYHAIFVLATLPLCMEKCARPPPEVRDQGIPSSTHTGKENDEKHPVQILLIVTYFFQD